MGNQTTTTITSVLFQDQPLKTSPESAYRPMSNEERRNYVTPIDEELRQAMPRSGPIYDYVNYARRTTDVDPWAHLYCILPAFLDMAGRKGFGVYSDPSDDDPMHPSIWPFIIAPPATGKSTAIKCSQRFYQSLAQPLKTKVSPYVTVEGTLPGVLSELASRRDEDAEQERGILVREEFSKVLKERDSWTETFCELYDGTACQRYLVRNQQAKLDGKSSVDQDLQHPIVQGLFATTNTSLAETANIQHVAGGLASRLLWLRLEMRTNQVTKREAKRERGHAFASWCDWIAWAETEVVTNEKLKVTFAPDVYDAIAFQVYDAFARKVQEDPDSPLNSMYKRAINHAQLLAGVFALSEKRCRITLDDYQRAEYCVARSLRTFASLSDSVGVDVDYAKEARVLKVLRAVGERERNFITRSELQQVVRFSLPTLAKYLAGFEEAGLVEVVRGKAAMKLLHGEQGLRKRGRPPHLYRPTDALRVNEKTSDLGHNG